MALAEVDGLRLLFDPLLADRHHGGVFEIVPPRERTTSCSSQTSSSSRTGIPITSCDVLDGRRHWGDLLLGGHLRACSRAYDVGERGLVRARVTPIFLYEALSYSASVERAVEHELRITTS